MSGPRTEGLGTWTAEANGAREYRKLGDGLFFCGTRCAVRGALATEAIVSSTGDSGRTITPYDEFQPRRNFRRRAEVVTVNRVAWNSIFENSQT